MSPRFQFRRKQKPPSARSVRTSGASGKGIVLLVGVVFLVAGSLATWFISVETWRTIVASQSWTETPVVILESRVVTSRTSDGTNYRPAITFTYEEGGRQYESDSWRVMRVSSSSRNWARNVVDTYPPGSRHLGWVNPADPSEAILDRSLNAWMALTLLPVLIVLIGFGLTGWGIFQTRSRTASSLVRSGDSLAGDELRDGKLLGLPEFPVERGDGVPIELRPRNGPWARMLGLGVFSVFWNAITWIILGVLISEGRAAGSYEIFPLVFLSFFALIGAVLLVAFFYTLLGFLFGPRVRVTAGTVVLQPGKGWEVSWQFSAGAARVRELRLMFEGQTEADYTQGSGKNSRRVTDKKPFLRQELFVSTDPGQIARGSAEIALPLDLPHSFEGVNNRIRYQVTLVATVAFMPNLSEAYPVFVPPAWTELPSTSVES